MWNPFRKKSTTFVELTPAMMMEKANIVVSEALNMFTRAVKSVEDANEILTESANKNEEKLKALQVEVSKVNHEKNTALDAIQSNRALKERLSQFIK